MSVSSTSPLALGLPQDEDRASSTSSFKPLPNPPRASQIFFPGPRTEKPKAASKRFVSRYNAWVEDWWLLELLSTLLGIGAVVALCIVLREYDNKPLPDWGSIFGEKITLNTILALLGIVVKASLMVPVVECISQLKWTWYKDTQRSLTDFYDFDNASRGPWGSLKLMWKLRGIHLAALGGLLTILTIAIDPFIQQSVLYTAQNIDNPSGKATVKIVQKWLDPTQDTLLWPSPSVIGTIYAATTSWNSQLADFVDVTPVCDSGNCTWSPYTSLGVCGSAVNVSSYVQTWFKDYMEYGIGPRIWHAQLPGGQVYEKTEAPGLMNKPYLNITSVPIDGTEHWDANISFPNSLSFHDIMNPISIAYMMFWEDEHNIKADLKVDNKTHYAKAFKAVEFALYWCVQTLESGVDKGEPWTRLADEQKPYGGFLKPNGTLGMFEANLTSKPVDHDGPTYEVNAMDHLALQRYFARLFSGEVWTGGGNMAEAQARLTSGSSGMPNDTPRGFADAYFGATRPSFNERSKDGRTGVDGVNMLMQNVGISLTNLRRRTSSATVDGVSKQTLVFVDVQWQWLAFIFTFTILTLIFFLATMFHQRKMTLWKSSSLAALHGLTPELQNSLGGLSLNTSLEEQAKGIMVKLIDRGDGWRLG